MVGQWGEEDEEIVIRSYNDCTDRTQVESLERSCEIGLDHQILLFTDTLGDPICRIRNSPLFTMLVAEIGKKLVGSIQGSVKVVELEDKLVKVGYVLGLRVAQLYRRRGIGTILVRKLEEWFVSHNTDFAYMATQKNNDASLSLFVGKLGYVVFKTPTILVNPVNHLRCSKFPSDIIIRKLKVEEAESWYRRHVAGTTEFFPEDIERILRNKLSIGTWIAYYTRQEESYRSWAMLSVWNSSQVFKLRIGKAPLSCLLFAKGSNFLGRFLPCLGLTALPDLFTPFGFYFLYGLHTEGPLPLRGKLVRALCQHIHNMAAGDGGACKVVVVEIDGDNFLRKCIPHWKMLSCDDDMWCIKPLRTDLNEFTKMPSRSRPLFVDPREV